MNEFSPIYKQDIHLNIVPHATIQRKNDSIFLGINTNAKRDQNFAIYFSILALLNYTSNFNRVE